MSDTPDTSSIPSRFGLRRTGVPTPGNDLIDTLMDLIRRLIETERATADRIKRITNRIVAPSTDDPPDSVLSSYSNPSSTTITDLLTDLGRAQAETARQLDRFNEGKI